MNDHNANHLLSGASHPTPSRRHRSSSSLSTRSANTAASGLTGISASTIGTTGGIAGSTSSGIAPARDPILSQIYPRETLSRHDSVTSSRRSEASSPSLASSLQQGDHFAAYQSHRSSQHGYGPQATNTVGGRAAAAAHVASAGPTSRFEEATHHRSELEMVKRENENLRRRVRELERSLNSRQRRLEPAPSNNNNNNNSPGTGGVYLPPPTGVLSGQLVGGGEEDDEVVHVGESAGSVGVGGGI